MSRDAWKRYQGSPSKADPESWFYEVTRPGFKYNMTDIQAAMGIAQLSKVAGFGIRRAAIAARYNEAFELLEELRIPAHRPQVDHAWHVYALRLKLDRLKISRDEFIRELRGRNISASVHFIPIHLHPYYRDTYGYKENDFPVAYSEFRKLVSLPIYPAMRDEDINDVIEAVTEIVAETKA
jgi:dTDP-4-amino-4,6-dideoxygalactose transaminase